MKYYLVPEEDIIRIENARKELINGILASWQLPAAINVTQAMFHLSHSKYKLIDNPDKLVNGMDRKQ